MRNIYVTDVGMSSVQLLAQFAKHTQASSPHLDLDLDLGFSAPSLPAAAASSTSSPSPPPTHTMTAYQSSRGVSVHFACTKPNGEQIACCAMTSLLCNDKLALQ
jgi:hypothetical protein